MKINHKAKSLHEALKVDVKDLNAKMKALHISLGIHKVKSSNVARLIENQFTKREILYLATSKALDIVEEKKASISKMPTSETGLEGLLGFLESIAKIEEAKKDEPKQHKPADASKEKGN